MATSTEILEACAGKCFTEFLPMVNESADLVKLYWSEVNTDSTYTALATTDAATFSTKLTKQEVINALTIAEQIDKFFQNQALAQSDYYLNIQGILHGNDERTSPGISPAIEAFGTRSVALMNSIITAFNCAKDTLDVWFDTEIQVAFAALTGDNVPWYDITVEDLNDGIVLIENFKKLINNEVATQANYSNTVANWRKILG